jgi:hypothetical protein
MKRVEVAKYFTLKGIWKANYICPKFHGKKNMTLTLLSKTVFHCGCKVFQGYPLCEFFFSCSID